MRGAALLQRAWQLDFCSTWSLPSCSLAFRTPHSPFGSIRNPKSVRQFSIFRFVFFGWNHIDSVPGTTIQESAAGSLAGAFLTTDTLQGINPDPSCRHLVVCDPDHAVFYRAVGLAGRRAGAPGTAFIYDCDFFWLSLPSCCQFFLFHIS